MKKIKYRCFEVKLTFLFLILLTSCSIQNQIDKDDFNKIPKDFSAHFYDQPDTIVYPYDNRIRVRSLIRDFTDVIVDYSKPIRIDLQQNKLYLNFEDTNQKKYALQFFGEKRQKKFIFYTNYETISFPILFMRKEMTKYTVCLSKSDEIIFENQSVSEGIVLFFGGASSSKRDYKFKLLKNE